MNRLEADYGGSVKFVYLDANGEGKDAFDTAKFRGHPAVLIMRPDGEEVWRYQGVATYEAIEEVLRAELD